MTPRSLFLLALACILLPCSSEATATPNPGADMADGALQSTASQEPSAPSGYTLSFDPSTPMSRSDRQLSSITLGATTLSIPSPDLMYNDLTPACFTVRAGDTVWPSFGYKGQWMQGYIYIDLDRNGRFDVQTPGSGGHLAEGNELLSFAGMNLDGGAYNSAGERLADLSGVQPPSFTVPDTLAPGLYMMRWKVDWNDCDPAGRSDESNSIVKNGGAIVDVFLQVTDEPLTDDYQLIFADEFDQPDGSQPDPAYWRVPSRSGSVWNRWISSSPDVAFLFSALSCPKN